MSVYDIPAKTNDGKDSNLGAQAQGKVGEELREKK